MKRLFRNMINANQYCMWSVLKSICFYCTQNVISAVLFCHVSSILFQTATNASLLSLQKTTNPLNQSQRTIPSTVNSTGNGGALNTPGILVYPHLLCTLWSTNKQKLGLHDKLHVIVMGISSVLWSHHAFWDRAEFRIIHIAVDHWQAMQYRVHNCKWIAFDYERL